MRIIIWTSSILVICLMLTTGMSLGQTAQPVSINPEALDPERAAAIEDIVYRAFESDWIGMEAGVAAEIAGEVFATNQSGQKRKLAKESGLQNGDTISTGSGAHIIIVMPDSSTYILGPNATVVINEFTFEKRQPSMDQTDITVKLGKFLYKTGSMAKRSPGSIKYRTPNVVAGVIGSMGAIFVDNQGNTYIRVMQGSIDIKGKRYGAGKFLKIVSDEKGKKIVQVLTRLQYYEQISGSHSDIKKGKAFTEAVNKALEEKEEEAAFWSNSTIMTGAAVAAAAAWGVYEYVEDNKEDPSPGTFTPPGFPNPKYPSPNF